MLFEIERELVAYGIIIGIVAVTIPAAVVLMRKRRRQKLRRRGIKTHGH